MKIRQVKTSGFRGLPDATFDLTSPTTGAPLDVVVVTGRAASGKTSFLEAIIAAKEDVAPYGFARSGRGYIRGDAEGAKVTVSWLLDDDERRASGLDRAVVDSESIFARRLQPPDEAHEPGLATLLERYSHDPAIGKFEYFPANRTLSGLPTSASGLRAGDQKLRRLEADPQKYAGLPRFLEEVGLGLRGPAEAERFQQIFGSLCRTKRFSGVRRDGERAVAEFVGAGGAVPLDALSHSEQQAVIFAGTARLIGLGRSIVLVDMPELYLASEDVVPFFQGLSALGEGNQIIVATGSREIAASVPAASVIRLG
jgi:hypothetical protein